MIVWVHWGNEISCSIQFASPFATIFKDGTFKLGIIFSDLRLDISKAISSCKNVADTTFVSSCIEFHEKIKNILIINLKLGFMHFSLASKYTSVLPQSKQ